MTRMQSILSIRATPACCEGAEPQPSASPSTSGSRLSATHWRRNWRRNIRRSRPKWSTCLRGSPPTTTQSKRSGPRTVGCSQGGRGHAAAPSAPTAAPRRCRLDRFAVPCCKCPPVPQATVDIERPGRDLHAALRRDPDRARACRLPAATTRDRRAGGYCRKMTRAGVTIAEAPLRERKPRHA
jgi:hypothetical protein